MKTLYLDCSMGAAGDMLSAALLELLPDPESFVAELNGLGLPDVEYRREDSVKCGIGGTHMSVLVHGREESGHEHDHGGHSHSHSGLSDIRHLVQEHLQVPEPVKTDILAVYDRLAQAESRVHGVPVTQIHFHEVGTLDALADVTAVCLLMNRLAPDTVLASPVHVGSGRVHCAHGILPVPAPATAELLRDVPIYGGEIAGELCTPTGAALLTHFVDRFGDMPPMRTRAIGYGMGKKDFEAANCIRAFMGDMEDASDTVLELSCNVDDMTGEELGFALERLLEGGALDAYTIPIGMKKSRPGVLLRVLCSPERRADMLELLFRHTTTIGVREYETCRFILNRSEAQIPTPWGPVRRKNVSGYGVQRAKYEYEDLAKIAREQGLSLRQVQDQLPKL